MPLARPEWLLILLFAASRLTLDRLGVRIERLPLEGTWQLIDPPLLERSLFESLLHLHSQPPLYNLLVGVLLRLEDPAAAARAMDLLYALLGLALVLLVYGLLRRLEVGRWTSFAAAALFTLSPAALLYENYPLYTQPAATLLFLCAFLFARLVRDFSRWDAFGLFLAMAALIYLRSLFQIGWLLVLFAFCLSVLPGHRRALTLTAALPLLLVGALYANHYFVAGQLSTSSWLGMSLAKLTTMELPLDERQALARAGVLSPLALQPPFAAPEAYPDWLAATPRTGIAVLDRTRKSGGAPNLNHAVYPAVSAQYLEDALTVIHRRPSVYLNAVATAHLMYFRPSADYPFLEPHRRRIEPLVRVYNRIVAGQPRYPREPSFGLGGPGEIGWLIVAAFLVCVFGAVPAVLRGLRGRAGPNDAVMVFLWLNVLYVTVVGNWLEMDENQRFRYLINPLMTVTLTVIVTRVCRRPYREPDRARRTYKRAFSCSSTTS
ncbi:MAG TPA: hypothetical protein VF210_11245 [Pseudomonadales bacterium]